MERHPARELGELINIGVGTDLTVGELADLVAKVVGFTGRLAFDTNKPDGTPQKLLDVSRLTRLGWRAKTELKDGIVLTYRDYLASLTRAAHG